MGRASPALPVLLALLGCGEAPRPDLRLDIPLTPERRALVLAVEGLQPPILRALPITEGRIDPLALDVALSDRPRITALLYDLPLAELGLEAGPLVAAPQPTGLHLPQPAAALTAQLEGQSIGAWSTLASLPALLAELELPHAPCAFFESHTVPLGAATTVSFALAMGSGAVLGSDEAVFFARSDAATRLQSAASFASGYPGEDGTLVLGGMDGAVWVGRLEPPGCESRGDCIGLAATLRHPAVTSSPLRFLDGTPDASEVYAYDQSRRVLRFATGDSSAVLYTFPAGYRTRGGHGGVVRVGPRHALAVDLNAQHVVRLLDGTVAMDQVPELECAAGEPLATDGFSSIARPGKLGTVLGSFCGSVHADRGAGWTLLRQRFLGAEPVRAMVAYEDGMLYVDDGKRVGQYAPALGFCDPFPQSHEEDLAERIAVVGKDVVAAGSPLRYRWLRMVPTGRNE